jgi:hypothetical protein
VNRARVATLVALGLGGTAALTGCSSPHPAAVAAVGFDGDAYMAVVRLCDEGRSVTHAQLAEAADGGPAVAWVGRTVEPITFYRLGSEPPDNWVLDVDGGLVSGVSYTFTASGEDLTVSGPEVTLGDLNALEADEVIDAAGTAQPVDDFLEQACTQ